MAEVKNTDIEHLKLISIFHYVLAGIVAVFSLFSIIHIGMGLSFITSPATYSQSDGIEFASEFGWFFVITGFVILIAGLMLAIGLAVSGRCLAKRKGYWFSFVIACIECLYAPLGTALGIFTLVVLCRDSVKNLYTANAIRGR